MKLSKSRIQKLVLINPNFITHSITDNFTIPALGLEYIAANVLDLVEVKIIDAKVRELSIKDIIKEIEEFSPDVVGISCCFTIGINFALKIAEESKKLGYINILGGWHPSFVPSEVLECPFIDVVVRGEGEITFRELIKNEDLENILGISYKINGKIIHNSDRPLVKNLNALPLPARHLRDKNSFFQIFQMPLDVIETSRGCPYECTFCNIHLFYKETYRIRETDHIIQELNMISNRGKYTNVLIVDDNFTTNMKRVEEICDKIISEGLKLDLICQSRVDVIKNNPDIIEKMAKAGFWLFFLGIESFNQKVLDNIQKRILFRDIVKAIKILHANNILIIGSLLIGANLDEEEKDIDFMIKMVKKLGIDFPIYSIMTPLPGTKFRDIIIEHNFLLSRDWSKYNFTTAVNRLNKLSKQNLENNLSKAYYYAYYKRGWKDTIIRLYKRKGINQLLNPHKLFSRVKEFTSFFINMRKMKGKKNSTSIKFD